MRYLFILCFIFVSCSYGTIKQNKHYRLIIRVNIVDDINYGPAVIGLAARSKTGGEIWVIGKQTKDGIVVDHEVLGHELCHILNWMDPSIKNPDNY
jgi:hypothetical protein